jgi:flagellin-specific chaperone FliS
MKKFTDMYKRNNIAGLSFIQIIAKAFKKAEALSNTVIEAIENNQIERRYLVSEELIRLLVEVHDAFNSDTPKSIDASMQKYCLQNISLLSKVNLKNDKELAITLKQSFYEVAIMWETYKAPTENSVEATKI